MTAGAEILHGQPLWRWDGVTVRAVAERAGVNERTVYRHFSTEADLRNAVLVELESEAGVDLGTLQLDTIAELAGRIFSFVSEFPSEARTEPDATFDGATDRQRDALRLALEPWRDQWPDDDREVAAAMLHVLWGLGTYERAVVTWGLDAPDAIRGLQWLIELVATAVREGNRPAPRRD